MVFTFLLALLGCPTEAPEGATDAPVPPAPTDGVAPPPTGTGTGTPSPQGGGVEPKLEVAPGEGVKVSGTASYDGEITAPIRLDLLKQGDGTMQRTHTMILEKMGPFELEVPKNYGSIQIAVLVETGGAGKPMAVTPWMDVTDLPIADIALTLTPLDPSAGPAVAPTGPPPDGTPPPPMDGTAPPPPGGAPPPAGSAPPPAGGSAPPPPASGAG